MQARHDADMTPTSFVVVVAPRTGKIISGFERVEKFATPISCFRRPTSGQHFLGKVLICGPCIPFVLLIARFEGDFRWDTRPFHAISSP